MLRAERSGILLTGPQQSCARPRSVHVFPEGAAVSDPSTLGVNFAPTLVIDDDGSVSRAWLPNPNLAIRERHGPGEHAVREARGSALFGVELAVRAGEVVAMIDLVGARDADGEHVLRNVARRCR